MLKLDLVSELVEENSKSSGNSHLYFLTGLCHLGGRWGMHVLILYE